MALSASLATTRLWGGFFERDSRQSARTWWWGIFWRIMIWAMWLIVRIEIGDPRWNCLCGQVYLHTAHVSGAFSTDAIPASVLFQGWQWTLSSCQTGHQLEVPEQYRNRIIVFSRSLKRYSKARRIRAPAYSRALRRIKGGFPKEGSREVKIRFPEYQEGTELRWVSVR